MLLVLACVLFSILASAQETYKPYTNFGYGIGYTYGA